MDAVPNDRICVLIFRLIAGGLAFDANPTPDCMQQPPPISGVEVIRNGRVEPSLHSRPSLSSSSVRWAGVAVENFSIPACAILIVTQSQHFVEKRRESRPQDFA